MALTKTIKKMISDFGGPYEPSLGNPSVNGYVLASTTGGTRSWVEMASGGSMVYPSGTGIAVVSGGTSWGTTLTGTANYIPYWSTSSAMTSSADLQYASNVLTINNTVRSPSAASSSANGENLVVKAGSAWSGGSGTYGRLYLSPGNHTISIGSFADMFFGDDTYNGGGINLKVAGAETNIALAIQSKGTSSLSLGSGTNTLLGLYASSSIQIWTTNLLTFASAVDGIIKGANSSSAGRHLTVQGGAGGSTFNGGNLYLYGGVASGTGTRGDVYFGDGTNGYLPAKGSETNILYYDTATGKISYATAPTGTSYTFQHSLTESGGDVNLVNDSASPGNSKYYGTNASGTRGFFDLPSGGSMVYPSGTGIAVVSGGTSWGTTLTGTAKYIPYWSTSSAMTSSFKLQFDATTDTLTVVNKLRTTDAESEGGTGTTLVLKAGNAFSSGSTGRGGHIYIAPGNRPSGGGDANIGKIILGGADYGYQHHFVVVSTESMNDDCALRIYSAGFSGVLIGAGSNSATQYIQVYPSNITICATRENVGSINLYSAQQIVMATGSYLRVNTYDADNEMDIDTFEASSGIVRALGGVIRFNDDEDLFSPYALIQGPKQLYSPRELIIKGGDGSADTVNGGDIEVLGGNAHTTGNNAGGNVYVYGGLPNGTGARGDVYFGDGTSGYLPAKGSETNVVYYNTSTGKLSYGAPSGGSMVYPSGTGIAVVSGGTSWGTTLTGTANYIPFWSDSSTLTSHANLQYASEVLTINHTVRSPSAANSGQNGTDLVIKAGDAWLGTTSSSYGLLYLSPGNVHTSGGLGGIIYLGDSTFNGGSVNFYALGTQTNIGLALVPKGNGIVLIGNKTTGSYVYLQSNYGIVIDVSFMTFGNSMEGVITGAGDSSAGRTLTLRGGEGGMGGGNHNGGNLYLYGGPKSGTGTRGDVYFGDGTNGYLPAKGSETNILYYDTANGKISYGAPSGGSMVYPSGTGIAVVSGGTSWGTTLTGTANYIPFWSDSSTLTSHANLQYASGVLTINNTARAPSAANSGQSGTNLVIKAGDAWLGTSGSVGGKLYLSPGNIYEAGAAGSIIYLGDSTYNAANIQFIATGTQTNIDLGIYQKGTGAITIGDDTTAAYMWLKARYLVLMVSTHVSFGSAIDGVIKGGDNASSAGRTVTIQGGAGGSTFNGGNLYFYGGMASGTGTRGDVYFGDGTNGYLPAKGSETNVVYYNTSTGKLSYGAVSGGSYTFQHSLTESGGSVNLVNDSASPGNSKYYGTNVSGTKGFFDLPAGGSLSKATYTEVNTGTDNDKYVTPYAIKNSNVAYKPIQVTSVVLGVVNWAAGTNFYEIEYSNANIDANSIVEIIPSNSDLWIAEQAQILPEIISSSGKVTIFARQVPMDDIDVTVIIQQKST